MSARRALTDQEAIGLEQWFSDYERVGTVAAKCSELGITPHTLYDTVRRIRGEDTRTTREKLSGAMIDQLANELLAGTVDRALHVEPAQTMEEDFATADEA